MVRESAEGVTNRAADAVGRCSLSATARKAGVGLTEAYDRFKTQFCDSIGIVSKEQKLQSNKSEYYRLFELSKPEVRSALFPLVEFDLKLYQFVSERFWQEGM